MRRLSRTLTAVLATIGVLVFTPSAIAATTLYTTPSPGASPDCSAAYPCSLSSALTMAVTGDTVVIGVGTYAPAANYSDGGKGLTIKGAVIGTGRPVVNGQIALSGSTSRLTDVEVDNTADYGVDLGNGASADRVISTSSSWDGCIVRATGATITNSLCVSNDATHSGLVSAGNTGTMAAHNVTAIGHRGFFANAGADSTDPGLTIADSIVRMNSGGDYDAFFNFGKTTLTNTNYLSFTTTATGSAVHTNQQTATPVFRGATDFREGSTSQTIDAGSDAAGPGELDLNGNLRKIGAHTDMGAYEFVPSAPSVTTSPTSPVAPTSATVRGTVHPNSGQTYYHLEYGPTAAHGTSTPIQILSATAGATNVQFDLAGLARKSTVHFSIVATSDGGTTTTPDATFDTPPLPPTATTGAATGITTASATLNGSVGTDATSGTAHFDVTPAGGTTFSTPSQTGTDGALSASLSGLSPRKAYSYVLVVHTAGGDATSNATPFTTAARLTPSLRFGSVGRGNRGQPLLDRSSIALLVRCGAAACTATAKGTVTIGRTRYGTLSAPKRATRIAANRQGTVKVTSSRSLRRRVRAYLLQHPRARAVLTITGAFTGADGKRVQRTLTIRTQTLKG